MGAGNVKRPAKAVVQLSESDSEDSIENNEKIKAVFFCDNEDLAQHEDLLVQACFCDLPESPLHTIYKFEQSLSNPPLKKIQ